MATKQPSKTSTVKAKPAAEKTTTAPKVSRARRIDDAEAMQSGFMRKPAYEEIAVRAYERFAARGYQHGHDVEDWLAAERELTS